MSPEQKLAKELKRRFPDHQINVERTKGGHYKVWAEGCRFITVSGSPSDFWAMKHVLGDLRRTLPNKGETN